MTAANFVLLIIALLVIIFGPLLVIWALNTLFVLAIPYTLQTWFATLVLGGLVGGTSASGS